MQKSRGENVQVGIAKNLTYYFKYVKEDKAYILQCSYCNFKWLSDLKWS